MLRTRWFFTVEPKYRRTDKGLVLVLAVIERPIVRSVKYIGAAEIKPKKLGEETGLKVGSPYDMSANKEAAKRLENYYHEQGYTEATVDLISGDKPEQRDVVFRIHEGVSQKVVWRYFVGNTSVSGERLAMELKTTPAYALIGGKFDPTNLAEDVAGVRKSTTRTWAFSMPRSSRPSNSQRIASGSTCGTRCRRACTTRSAISA